MNSDLNGDPKESFGAKLKRGREQRGLSLQEVALSLKIGSRTLRAIEEGDTKNFPAKTFLRGFIQSYATYLKLNAQEILDLFYAEFGSTQPKSDFLISDSPEKTPTVLQRPDLKDPVNFKTISLAAAAIVLVIGIVVSKKVIDKYQREAELPSDSEEFSNSDSAVEVTPDSAGKSQPIAVQTQPLIVSPSPSVPSPAQSSAQSALGTSENKLPTASSLTAVGVSVGAASPGSPSSALTANSALATSSAISSPASAPAPTPNTAMTAVPKTVAPSPQPVALKNPESSSPPLAATPAGQASSISATDIKTEPLPAAGISRGDALAPSPAPGPSAEVKPPVRNLELIVEALDAVDLEFTDSRGRSQIIKLKADQVHTFKSNAGLNVKVSNGGAVNLILNGKDLGIKGELGKSLLLNY